MERGARLGNETLVGVGAKEKVRPLRDYIIIEPLEWEPSKTVKVVYRGRPLRGKVKAVGEGRNRLQYRNKNTGEWAISVPKGLRSEMRESKAFQRLDVKVGDIVELTSIVNADGTIDGMLFQTFRWGDKEHIICQEADVCLIHE